MARYRGSVCRLCRREGEKLFLKGDRCYTDKCAFERRNYAPGQQGQKRRRKQSDYGEQLREKQRVKRMYGLLERQFKNYYHHASRMKGVTGENLLGLLERRFDNVVFRLGFACNRAEARQFVLHRHFTVNGVRVNIPSYQVREGDVIEVRAKSQSLAKIGEALSAVERRGLPAWVELDKDGFKGKITTLPSRQDITMPIREQLIVELYSK